MNKMIMTAAVAAMMVSGCKSIPTTDSMYNMSMAFGYTAGLVANETKIDDTSRNVIIDIVGKVQSCTPEVGQTFAEAWTPIAQAHTEKLIAEGKISKEQADLILSGFNFCVKGLDYLFEVRFPEAKQYKDLVEAAINGGTTGFLKAFKPVNARDVEEIAANYDRDAYEYLKK